MGDTLPSMPVELKKVLWANVLELMKDKWGGENLTKLAREGKLGPGTAQRIKESETSVGIDIVAKVASVFKVAPHQLLVPTQDKNALRLLRAYYETDEKGRLLLETAIEAAEQRASAKRSAPGESKTGPTIDT
jgi:hypothetical protein